MCVCVRVLVRAFVLAFVRSRVRACVHACVRVHSCFLFLSSHAHSLFPQVKNSTALSGAGAVHAKNLAVAAGAAGRILKRKIIITVAVQFVTFVLRAVFSIFNATANALANTSQCPQIATVCHDCYVFAALFVIYDFAACSPAVCAECLNVYGYIQTWLLGTPGDDDVNVVVVIVVVDADYDDDCDA